MATTDRMLVSVPPVSRSALSLLAQARQARSDAYRAISPGERFRLAHIAALRAAAALSAGHPGPPVRRRRQVQSAWTLVTSAVPDLAPWAAYFAAGAADRAAIEAGVTSAVSEADAEDQLRAAETFVDIVDRTLHAPDPAAPALAS